MNAHKCKMNKIPKFLIKHLVPLTDIRRMKFMCGFLITHPRFGEAPCRETISQIFILVSNVTSPGVSSENQIPSSFLLRLPDQKLEHW